MARAFSSGSMDALLIGSGILVLSCFTYLFLFLSKQGIVEQEV